MLINPFAFGSAPTYDSIILATSGLMGFWPLYETSGAVATDISPNGRNGVIVGSPTQSSSGVTLNGSSQCITFPDTAFDIIGNAGQSYTLEIFFTSLAGASPVALFDKTNTSAPDWNLLQYVTDTPHFQLYDGTNNPIATGGSFSSGNLLHAVRDVSTNTIKLYLNGALESSVTASSAIDTDNTTDLCIGARQAGTDRFANGKFWRAAAYNVALSAADISARWAARNT